VEDTLIKSIAEAGATFVLLAYIVYSVIGLFRTLIEHNTTLTDTLVETNSKLTEALRGFEESRLEQSRTHQEQTVLIKLVLDKLAERIDG
jgi:hypothetical protein